MRIVFLNLLITSTCPSLLEARSVSFGPASKSAPVRIDLNFNSPTVTGSRRLCVPGSNRLADDVDDIFISSVAIILLECQGIFDIHFFYFKSYSHALILHHSLP